MQIHVNGIIHGDRIDLDRKIDDFPDGETVAVSVSACEASLDEKRKLIDSLCGAWADDDSITPIFEEINRDRIVGTNRVSNPAASSNSKPPESFRAMFKKFPILIGCFTGTLTACIISALFHPQIFDASLIFANVISGGGGNTANQAYIAYGFLGFVFGGISAVVAGLVINRLIRHRLELVNNCVCSNCDYVIAGNSCSNCPECGIVINRTDQSQ